MELIRILVVVAMVNCYFCRSINLKKGCQMHISGQVVLISCPLNSYTFLLTLILDKLDICPQFLETTLFFLVIYLVSICDQRSLLFLFAHTTCRHTRVYILHLHFCRNSSSSLLPRQDTPSAGGPDSVTRFSSRRIRKTCRSRHHAGYPVVETERKSQWKQRN